MACVTLKRPVEALGSPHLMEHEPTVKRRRCGMSMFPTTSPGTSSALSVFPESGRSSPSPVRHHSPCGSPFNRRVKRKLDDHFSVNNTPTSTPQVSPFLNVPMETGKLVAQELKRIQRRSNSGKEQQPLFTLKQVTIVCQRMIKEREELIRSEYDKALTTKLAEQYDTFVKFSHDQVERRLAESAFSYVS